MSFFVGHIKKVSENKTQTSSVFDVYAWNLM